MDDMSGLFLGKERSWMILCSMELSDLGTVPSSDVQKGPIRSSSLELEKGLEYQQRDNSLCIWDRIWSGKERPEL